MIKEILEKIRGLGFSLGSTGSVTYNDGKGDVHERIVQPMVINCEEITEFYVFNEQALSLENEDCVNLLEKLDIVQIEEMYIDRVKIIGNGLYGDPILLAPDGHIFEPPLHRINSGTRNGIYTTSSFAQEAFKNYVKRYGGLTRNY